MQEIVCRVYEKMHGQGLGAVLLAWKTLACWPRFGRSREHP